MTINQTILPGFDSFIVSPTQIETTAQLPDYAITDPQRIGEVLNVLDRFPFYAFDVETTSLDFSRGKLHGMSFGVEEYQWYVFGNALEPMIHELVKFHYNHPKVGVVGHNLKFDLHFMAPYGYRPRFIADTQIAQKLVDENTERKLKTLAYTRLGIEGLPTYEDLAKEAAVFYVCKNKKCSNKTEYRNGGHCPSCLKPLGSKRKKLDEVTIYDIPLEKLVPYAARDTRLTYDLWKVLKADLQHEGMYKIFFDYEMPFLYVLLDMEENGIYIDQGRVSELEHEIKEQLEEAQHTWNTITGGVNANSNKDLPEYLFNTLKLPVKGTTDTGKPSTDALALMRLEPLDKTGAVAALRKMRELEKILGTYIVNFQTMVNEDGRLRTNFNQDGARTHRLSSSGNINLQNIPSRSDLGKRIRDAFAAQSEDTVMLVADYSQLELRLVAHFSQEPKMVDAFLNGDDPHQVTADMMGVARAIGKTLNFGTVYGQGPRTMCDTIEESGKPRPKESEAKEWLKKYDQTYPILKRWKWAQVDYAREHGFVTTILGRKRRLPDINSFDNSLRSRAERQSYNAPIQGSAADVAMTAMIDIHPFLGWYDAKMLAQVHDELVFEVPKSAAEEFGQIVQEKMEGVGDKFGLRVKLEAGPGTGRSWAAAKH